MYIYVFQRRIHAHSRTSKFISIILSFKQMYHVNNDCIFHTHTWRFILSLKSSLALSSRGIFKTNVSCTLFPRNAYNFCLCPKYSIRRNNQFYLINWSELILTLLPFSEKKHQPGDALSSVAKTRLEAVPFWRSWAIILKRRFICSR